MSDISRLKATVTAYYPDSNTSGVSARVPNSVVISEEVGRHTLITLEHAGKPEYLQRSLLTGSPVQVATSSRAGQRSWFGYVTAVEPSTILRYTTRVTALGVTYHMKRTSNTVWGPQPVAKTMSELIYRQGLTPFVEDTGIIQEVPQAGRTDFELLNDLASMCGLMVFTTGTTVNCLSPAATMEFFHDEATRIAKVKKQDTTLAIDSMLQMSETSDQLARSRVSAALVDPVTARVYSETSGSGLFVDQGGSVVARNPDVLRTQTKGMSAQVKFPFRLHAEGPGNAALTAGKPVWANYLGDTQWWLTSKVEHSFSPASGDHTMVVDLRRTGDAYDYPEPPKSAQRGMLRSLPKYCFCREHEPVLVGPQRATYITSVEQTSGTDLADYGWPEVADWAEESPVAADPHQYQPFGAWASMRRWRARGKCQ